MVARQRRITDMLMADPAVKTVGVRLGSGRQGSSAQFNIELKSRSDGRRETTAHALARLSAKADRYPDLQLRLRAIQDLPSNDGGGSSQGAQYRISLQGNDLASLQEWLPKLQAELKKNPKLRDVGTDVDNAGLRQNIQIDRAKAARLGITVGAIDGALYGAFGQRQISTIYSDINQYSVVVNALPSQTATPAALDEVYVRARNGDMVPITAVATQMPGLAPSQITHENQYTTMDLSYNLAPNVSMGEAKAIIDATVAGMRMPGDIRLADDAGFGFNSDPSDMLILVFAAILTVYLVLGMLYESLIHPITILSTLPAAGVGALLALFGTNTELSVISMIALVLLIGIVKKNAIMMIDFALVAQREHGLAPRDAARGQHRALPPDHDDHDGGDPGGGAAGDRPGRRLRTAPPAGHRDDRRPAVLAEPDPAQHAGAVRDLLVPGRTLAGPSRAQARSEAAQARAACVERPIHAWRGSRVEPAAGRLSRYGKSAGQRPALPRWSALHISRAPRNNGGRSFHRACMPARQSRLSRLWAHEKASYGLRVFIALTAALAVCWQLDALTALPGVFLGIIASAIAETDDNWWGRTKAVALSLLCFCIAAASVIWLFPGRGSSSARWHCPPSA